MASQQGQDARSNRYRLKCPGPLSVPTTQRFQPYNRPLSACTYRVSPQSLTPTSQNPYLGNYYVPTPPCPAPGTWANTFSYDDYSTKVWANDIYQQQRMYLHFQSALLQRNILMAESRPHYPSCVYTPTSSTPCTPSRPDNIAVSMMQEESDSGYLSMGIISRVSPDGDICDDVLDPGNCPPETPNDIPETVTDDCDTSVPSINSPVVYTSPTVQIIKPEPLSSPVPSTPVIPVPAVTSSSTASEQPESKPAKKSKKAHQEPGRYVCNVCGKVFGWRTGLVTHLRVHTGERPYMCPDCPKSFSDYSTYAKHCRIHSGVKPYSCDVCGKAFSQSGNRLRHMRTVHKDKQ